MRRLLRAALPLCFALLALCAAPPGAGAQATGSLRGRVELGVEGVPLSAMGPIVVYLAPIPGDPTLATTTARVRQKNATFAPGFLAIAAGQTVEMVNDDTIFHNVFSFSKPNDFDLGIYPSGKSRFVTFQHPGVVRTYCSIHESMNGTIFVSPSPHFAVVDADGSFTIDGVPPGRHRLLSWCERLPEAAAPVEVKAGQPTSVTLTLGKTGS